MLDYFIHVWLCDPLTADRQAPQYMGFPRQEYWSGLPFPSPEDLPDPGIELTFPALGGGFFTTEPSGMPYVLWGRHKETLFLSLKHLWGVGLLWAQNRSVYASVNRVHQMGGRVTVHSWKGHRMSGRTLVLRALSCHKIQSSGVAQSTWRVHVEGTSNSLSWPAFLSFQPGPQRPEGR